MMVFLCLASLETGRAFSRTAIPEMVAEPLKVELVDIVEMKRRDEGQWVKT